MMASRQIDVSVSRRQRKGEKSTPAFLALRRRETEIYQEIERREEERSPSLILREVSQQRRGV